MFEVDPKFKRLSAGLHSAEQVAHILHDRRIELLEVLTRHESYETALDEIDRSIDTLRGLHRELQNLRTCSLDSMAVFLPINLPLYSLVLFAAVPSLMVDRVEVRTPATTPQWVNTVWESSGLSAAFPNVTLHTSTRRDFIDNIASCSDAILFTGRYENAESVRATCKKSLFIYEGSGPNPIVIGPECDLVTNLDRVIDPRLFNSGQDCAGPDAYLVADKISNQFLELLLNRLDDIEVGTYDDPSVRIGPIQNRGGLKELARHVEKLSPYVLRGGRVDISSGFVDPTVSVMHSSEYSDDFEFFAPVFNVLVYGDQTELADWFKAEAIVLRGMYASFFGEVPPAESFVANTVLVGKTILDVDQGNCPYGGFGAHANFVSCGEEVLEVGPLLVSEVLARFGRIVG